MTHPNICNKCGVELTDNNWYPSRVSKHHYICNSCSRLSAIKWDATNLEKLHTYSERFRRKAGHRPIDEDKYSALYLGVYIAEQVLLKAFPNVTRMPVNNIGYDFVCSREKKVDVKASCIHTQRGSDWAFMINKNKIADAFVCIAFDDRENLNPIHIWLIPGHVVNDKVNVGISKSTIDKWDEYRLDIDKVITCCNAMKEGDI